MFAFANLKMSRHNKRKKPDKQVKSTQIFTELGASWLKEAHNIEISTKARNRHFYLADTDISNWFYVSEISEFFPCSLTWFFIYDMFTSTQSGPLLSRKSL